MSPSPEAPIWHLPTELLDHIFNLVYNTEDHDFPLTTRAEFEAQAAHLRHMGLGVYKTWTDQPKINDFLVSKDWFLLAINAFFASQKWSPSTTVQLVRSGCGVFIQFARDVSLRESWQLNCLQGFQKLRVVEVHVSWHSFLDVPGKDCWIDEFDEQDFTRLAVYRQLLQLRGLKDLVLVADGFRYARTASSRSLWSKNVAALRLAVLPHVTSPRTRAETVKGPRPLYVGSRVCVNSNSLLEEDRIQDTRRPWLEQIGPGLVKPPASASELVNRIGMMPEELWYWYQQHNDLPPSYASAILKRPDSGAPMFPELRPDVSGLP